MNSWSWTTFSVHKPLDQKEPFPCSVQQTWAVIGFCQGRCLAVFAQFSPEPEIPGALPNAPELGVGMGKKHILGVGPEIGRNFSFANVLKNNFKNFWPAASRFEILKCYWAISASQRAAKSERTAYRLEPDFVLPSISDLAVNQPRHQPSTAAIEGVFSVAEFIVSSRRI